MHEGQSRFRGRAATHSLTAFIKIVANASGSVYLNAYKPDPFQNLVVCLGNRPIRLGKIQL